MCTGNKESEQTPVSERDICKELGCPKCYPPEPKPEAPSGGIPNYCCAMGKLNEPHDCLKQSPKDAGAREWWIFNRDPNGEVFHWGIKADVFFSRVEKSIHVIEKSAYEKLERDWERLNIKCGDYSLENETLKREFAEARAELSAIEQRAAEWLAEYNTERAKVRALELEVDYLKTSLQIGKVFGEINANRMKAAEEKSAALIEALEFIADESGFPSRKSNEEVAREALEKWGGK
jgi:hypothetical protein